MLVISNSCPTAPHLHSSSINMLETGKLATSPSTTPQPRQSDMPSPSSGLEQSSEFASPSNPPSEVMTSPFDVDPYLYVSAGTGKPISEEDSLPRKTEFPLLTTFPTEVPPTAVPDLASTAGDCEGYSDVVSALIGEDSTHGDQSFESLENLGTDSMKEENGLTQEESTVQDELPTSSSPPSAILGDDEGKPAKVSDSNSPRNIISGDPEESVHLIQNIYAHSESVASGEI